MKVRAFFFVVVDGVPLAACIFDSGGDYQGGGRRESVSTDDTSTATATNTVATVVPPLSTAPDAGTSTVRDAATDG